MSIAIRFAARSNIGLGRYRNNQDSGYAGPHLLAVCDGMGGHAGGDVASSIAIGQLAALDGDSIGADAPQQLVTAIRDAHAAMLARVEEDPELAGMGTTVTAILRFGTKLALAHVGDSRAYLLSGEEFHQVTADHTFVQWLVDQGRITLEEADVHPQRSVVMRVVGDVDADDDIDLSIREAVVGDRWLLCSDGLSNFVSAETLRDTLQGIKDPHACAEELIDLALKGGGQDNITCIVADMVRADKPVDAVPQVVGAASIRASDRPTGNSPAAKAALLAQADDDEEDDLEVHPVLRRQKLFRALISTAVILGFLGAICLGLWYGYRWSQRQFYVGVSDNKVAIYRGLSQDLGPWSMSRVHETSVMPLDSLSARDRQLVEATRSAANLAEAREMVHTLLLQSRVCQVVATQPITLPQPPDPNNPTGAGTPNLTTQVNYLNQPIPAECSQP